ncbi:MAG: hypothetical protein C4529_12915 [Deltaproteobacteria bacterium]|nr:MAG: hypothetical protein C4529_12915 [Deltaproteobacteria bacterium]
MISPQQFLLAKKISLVEAQSLSGKKTSGAPPPPPKPQPKKEPLKAGDSLGAPGVMKAPPAGFMALAFLSIGRGIWLQIRSHAPEIAIDDADE